MASIFAESGILNGIFELAIYYEDTDLSGFVYHANYLKYCERAREHIIGIEFLADLQTQGLHFVVSKAQLEYKAPARHADRLKIVTKGLYSRSPAITFEQLIFKNETKSQETLLVKAEVTIVLLNHLNRPIRMPDILLEHFAKDQSSPINPIINEERPPW